MRLHSWVVLATMPLLAASCERDPMWRSQEACDAAAYEHRSDQFPSPPPHNEFKTWLLAEVPVGSHLDQAFETLRSRGFQCSSGDDAPPTGPWRRCERRMTAGFLVTRDWVAVPELDQDGQVAGFQTNCGMTGP